MGATLAEIAAKQAAKARLDRALAPFRIVAAAWAGGVMLGPRALRRRSLPPAGPRGGRGREPSR